MTKRPSLAVSFAEGLALAAKHRGATAYFPFWILVCLGLGALAAFSIPASFWSEDKWDVSVAFYGGLLAFDGLLLAVGWSAFSKIYEIIGGGEFAAFLRRNGLLNVHLLYVDLAQITMVASVLITGAAMIGVLGNLVLLADRILLALSIAASGYSVIKAIGATRAMQDLIWESAHQSEDDQRPELRTVR